MVVSIEVAHNQGVASEVPPKQRGKDRSESTGAGGGGGDIEVDNRYFNPVYCDDDTLVFSGIIANEEIISIQWFIGGVLPDEEGESPSPVRGGSVAGYKGVPTERNRVGVGGEFRFLEAGHPDVVGGLTRRKFVRSRLTHPSSSVVVVVV